MKDGGCRRLSSGRNALEGHDLAGQHAVPSEVKILTRKQPPDFSASFHTIGK